MVLACISLANLSACGKFPFLVCKVVNNAPTGRKRAPKGAADMRACQNPWQSWYTRYSEDSKWLPSKGHNRKTNPENQAAAVDSCA